MTAGRIWVYGSRPPENGEGYGYAGFMRAGGKAKGRDRSQPFFVALLRFCRNPAYGIREAARLQPAIPWAPSPR